MKFAIQLLSVLTLFFVFESCKKKPTACFTTDLKTTGINMPIKCDASCSKNATKYFWLGDGIRTGNSTDPAISTVTYNQTGTYIIKLEVTNGRHNYQQDIVSQTVKIY